MTHIFDRSNLDEIVMYNPKERRNVSRREDLTSHQYHRSDVVLLNCTRSGREYSLHVTETGFAGDLWILDILTDVDHEEVTRIARRMRQNALEYPPASRLLAGASV